MSGDEVNEVNRTGEIPYWYKEAMLKQIHGEELALEVNIEAQNLGKRITDMEDELASLVSTHREDYMWSDLIEDIKSLLKKVPQPPITSEVE